MRAMLLCSALMLLAGCAFVRSTEQSKASHKPTGITEETCYQDCRNDLQTDEFCRARCTD